MKTLLGWLGVPLIAGLITWYCTDHAKPFVETDLISKTQNSLSSAGISGAMVDAEGLLVKLTGVVPDEATKAKAGLLAAAVWGVVDVRNELTVQPGAVMMTTQERKAAVDCQGRFNDLLKSPVQFATGSAVISASSYPLLDRLVAAAKLCPAAQIEIGGHTDPRGAHDMNVQLSQSRANAVLTHLAQKGIAAKQLSAVGYGPDKPIADNSTAAGMEKNRRTEFIVKGLN